jgi:hypothetical protein
VVEADARRHHEAHVRQACELGLADGGVPRDDREDVVAGRRPAEDFDRHSRSVEQRAHAADVEDRIDQRLHARHPPATGAAAAPP